MIALLLGTCCASALCAVRRPAVWLGLGLVTAMLPVGVTRSWLAALGPFATVPPAVWVFLAGTATILLSEHRTVPRVTRLLLITTVTSVTASLGTVFVVHGTSAAGSLFVLWILPIAGFVALVAATTGRDVDVFVMTAPTVVTLALGESLFAIAQRVAGNGLLFEEYRSAAAQFGRTGRSTGTFDTPLDLAAFLTLALTVAVRDRHPLRMWCATVVVAVGTVCSGSRTGMVLTVGVVALTLAVRGTRRIADLLLASSVTVAAALAGSSAWAQQYFTRFGDGGDRSAWARDLARDTGFRLVESRPLTGSGLEYSYEYALANLPSSFEDAWLSLAIGAGLPVTAMLLALPVGVSVLPGPPALVIRATALITLIWGFSYSAYTATSTFGVLAWTFLGLCASGLHHARTQRVEADRRQGASDAPALTGSIEPTLRAGHHAR